MTIAGIGIDIVLVSRIDELIERYGERFLEKVFSRQEIEEGSKKMNGAQFFAARFAAREAFFKALGTGWGRGLSLRDVSVAHDELGRPFLNLSERAEGILGSMEIAGSHLSMTHEEDSALAIVILEKR
jgi:holo-[acyl-carrier protein] synthase